MITEIAEHSVDLSLLGSCPANILDIGCRGFGFADHFGGENVYSIDIDKLEGDSSDYYRCAISDTNSLCGIVNTNDPQARHITDGNDIIVMTIDSFSKLVGVEKWDLIKMDIEGEEIKVLKSLKHPYCKQISVEFHAHVNQTKEELDSLLDWLSEWYTIHNRNWVTMHGAGYNYWDILLIAK